MTEKLISRIFKALNRYSIALRNLGLHTTLQLIWYRVFRGCPNIEIHSVSKKFGSFFWNVKKDWVINHFYTPQIEVYSPKEKISIHSIVDLGANIGAETIRFGLLYPDARIYSVEANKENYEKLSKNSMKRLNVTTIFAAIWSSECKLKLISTSHDDSQAWRVAETSEAKFDMKGMPLSKILSNYAIDSIDILKVDIEGAEYQLFDSTADVWISKVNCFIVEAPDNDAPGTTQHIYRLFERNGIKVNTYVNGENIVFIRDHLDWKVRFIENY